MDATATLLLPRRAYASMSDLGHWPTNGTTNMRFKEKTTTTSPSAIEKITSASAIVESGGGSKTLPVAQAQQQKGRRGGGGGGGPRLAKTVSLPGVGGLLQRVHVNQGRQQEPTSRDLFFFGRGDDVATTTSWADAFAETTAAQAAKTKNNVVEQEEARYRIDEGLSPSRAASRDVTAPSTAILEAATTSPPQDRQDQDRHLHHAAMAAARAPAPKIIPGRLTAAAPSSSLPVPSDVMIAADLLYRAVQISDWPTVLLLATSHPRSVSVPVEFRFRGERTTATLLHEVCIRHGDGAGNDKAPPDSVLDAIVEAYPDAVMTGDEAGGRLPIHVAVMEGAPSTVLIRLIQCRGECAAKKDDAGNALLHHAAAFGDDESIIIALEACSSPSGGAGRGGGDRAAAAPNERGRTPLHLLCARCGLEGSSLSSDDSSGSSTIGPSGAAIFNKSSIQLDTIESLLESHPAAVSQRDRNGRLPLHEASNSFNPRWDIVKMLLDSPRGIGTAGARDNRGNIPLDLLRAVNLALLSNTKSSKKKKKAREASGEEGVHPTLIDLIKATKSAKKKRWSNLLLPDKTAAKGRTSLPASRIVRRALSSLQQDRHRRRRHRRRRSDGHCVSPSDRPPVEEDSKCISGTYPWYASPVTTVKKKGTYTLPH